MPIYPAKPKEVPDFANASSALVSTFTSKADLERQRQDARESLGRFTELAAQTAKTIRQGEAQLDSADDAFRATLQALTTKMDEPYQVVTEASRKLEKIEQLPDVLTNILGIFNPDYNRDVQRIRQQRAMVEAEQIGKRLDTAKTLYDMRRRDIADDIVNAGKEFQLASEVLTKEMTLKQFDLELARQYKAEQIEQVNAMTIEQLEKIAATPGKTRWPLGLIKKVIRAKRLLKSQTELGEFAVRTAQVEEQIKEASSNYNDAQIAKMYEEAQSGVDTVDRYGLPKGIIINEHRRRIKQKNSLMQAQAAAQAANQKALDLSIEQFLEQTTEADLLRMSQIAKKEGAYTLNLGKGTDGKPLTYRVSNTRILAAYEKVKEANVQITKATVGRTRELMGVGAELAVTENSLGNFNRISPLSAADQVWYTQSMQQVKEFAERAQKGEAGALEAATDKLKEIRTKINETREAYAARFDKEVKPVIEEFVDTGDNQKTAKSWAAYTWLGGPIDAGFLRTTSDLLRAEYGDRLAEENQLTIPRNMGRDGDLSIPLGKKQIREELVARIANDPNIAAQYSKDIVSAYWVNAMADFVKVFPQAEALFNPRSRTFTEQSLNERGAPDAGIIFQRVMELSVDIPPKPGAEEMGVVEDATPITQLMEILRDPSRILEFDRQFRNNWSIDQATIVNLVGKGRITNAIYDSSYIWTQQLEGARRRVVENREVAKRQADVLMQAKALVEGSKKQPEGSITGLPLGPMAVQSIRKTQTPLTATTGRFDPLIQQILGNGGR